MILLSIPKKRGVANWQVPTHVRLYFVCVAILLSFPLILVINIFPIPAFPLPKPSPEKGRGLHPLVTACERLSFVWVAISLSLSALVPAYPFPNPPPEQGKGIAPKPQLLRMNVLGCGLMGLRFVDALVYWVFRADVNSVLGLVLSPMLSTG